MKYPMEKMAAVLIPDICPGCVYFDDKPVVQSCQKECLEKPCPFFLPSNFYYDSDLKRFWCRVWTDNRRQVANAGIKAIDSKHLYG